MAALEASDKAAIDAAPLPSPAPAPAPAPVQVPTLQPQATALLAEQLAALKAEGKELATLHREARARASQHLPELGSLLDAEEDMLEALTRLRSLSPLLLVDGATGAGKTSLLNALLLCAEEAPLAEGDSADQPRRQRIVLPLERPARKARRPLIVRAPAATVAPATAAAGDAASPSQRRYLEGRPSLQCNGAGAGTGGETRLRALTEEEWRARCCSEVGDTGDGDGCRDDEQLPLILEDPRARGAWGDSLWLAEVDLADEAAAAPPQWVSTCGDAVCMLRTGIAGNDGTGGGTSAGGDGARRLGLHLERGRRVLLVANVEGQADVDEETCTSPSGEALQAAERDLRSLVEQLDEEEAEQVDGVLALSLSSLRDWNDRAVASSAPGSCEAHWAACAAAFRDFARRAEGRRLAEAYEQLSSAREAFVRWCTQGTKVVSAANTQFQQDSEDVRLARDLITRNIDAAYLAHVFSSVLVGKFAALCAQLENAPAPDLEGRWGRHSTRQVMERSLREQLEQGLRLAMQESLEEVTAEMAKQERPSVERIQQVARRGTRLPWDAEVRRLEVELDKEQLQHFALQFFGSLSVGVLSGIGALALEALLGELALGPVGVVAGVATFVVIGVQNADWPSVRKDFVRKARARHLELVARAKEQLDFPGLCERRRRRILEQMDLILQRLMSEIASLTEASSEFARCALVLSARPQLRPPTSPTSPSSER